MISATYLVLICQVALSSSFAAEVGAGGASCSAGGSQCGSGELGLSDDTQVLLQGQRMAITEHSQISQLPPQHLNFQVNPSDYYSSMTLVTAVEINGVRQAAGDLLVFVGDKLQGISKASNTPHFGPQNGKALYDIMIYGNSDTNKDVTFAFLTPEGKIVLLDPIGMAAMPVYTPDTRLSNLAGSINHINPLMLKPPPPKCKDGSQADMDAYIAKHFPGFAYPGLTCAMFLGWGQCILVHPVCGQTCPDQANAGHCSNALAQTQERDEAHLAPSPPPSDTSYQVVPSDYENSMSTVAIVEIDGVLQSQGDVLVFVNEKLQGIQGTSNIPPMPQKIRGVPGHTNTPCWDLMIYGHGDATGGPPSDANKKLVFEFLTPQGKLVPLKTPTETEVFSANAHLANHLEPLLLTDAVTPPATR